MTENDTVPDDPETDQQTDPAATTMTETDATTDAPTDADDSSTTGAASTADADTATATGPEGGTDDASDADDSTDRDVLTYLYWGALVVLGLLATTALLRFYTSAGAAIATWIAPRFEPIIQAAFNLVVLLAAGVGISLVVRELSG